MRLKSDYAVGEIPHDLHPMPQARRRNWLCLNGKWELTKMDARERCRYFGDIIVPFSPESLLSGVKEGFVLEAEETLVYTRKFLLGDDMLLGVTKLHFGAVDSRCRVIVNGTQVGAHTGGFTAFSFDISDFVKKGENEIIVRVQDEGTRNHGARGKQSDKHGGIWYTPQSGIWQTVWLESMPKQHISGLKITPNATDKSVRIQVDGDDEKQIAVLDNGKQIMLERFTNDCVLRYDFALWSPENPKLYDFVIRNQAGDELYSYFGVRSFGQAKDKNGKMRLTLNGKPYFFNGVLDQGYFSDGMLTYPSEQAIVDELKLMKEMGFNTLRKHIKIEPMRWYYHCDRLGIAVWQDFVNGGGEYKFTHIAAFPFLGFHHKDNDYKYFARENERGRQEFAEMVDETLTQLYNCTCIAVWVPFNEGWGQFDSAKWTAYVREKDATRIIDSVSGWHDQGVGQTHLKSLHIYYTKLKVPKDPRPVVLSEFGGYSWKIDGHVYAEDKEFGYKKFKSRADLVSALKKLYLQKLKPLIAKGLCGCIYTQVSDVEEEINGLVTYDRKVVKVPPIEMSKINKEIMSEASKVELE